MALIDKETIRKEIERLKDKISIGLSEYDMGYENGMGETCNDLLAFLDTLPDEQPTLPAGKEQAKKDWDEENASHGAFALTQDEIDFYYKK